MLSLFGLIGDNEKTSQGSDEKRILSTSEIDEMCSRLGLKTSLEEKRRCMKDIIGALSVSKVEVSCVCMDAVLQTLRSYRTDKEIITAAFDILISIMRPAHTDQYLYPNNSDLSSQFGEIFLKKYENVQLTVDFLQTHMKDIKGQAVTLLSILAELHPQRLQSVILEVTLGIPRLTDLLDKQDDIIRSQVLFILKNVIQGSSDIRKMLVFENIFQKLMNIITEENGLDGSHLVIDALEIIKILVNEDQSVQNHFRQSGLYYKLWTMIVSNKDFYSLHHIRKQTAVVLSNTPTSVQPPVNPFNWSDCSISIFKSVLEIFQSFTSVNFSVSTVISFQHEMRTSGIMEQVIDWIIKITNFPKSLQIELIYTLSGFVRGNKENCQNLFVSVKYNDSSSFLYSKLLEMMMDSRIVPSHRLAIFHLIQSLTVLCENPFISAFEKMVEKRDSAGSTPGLETFQILQDLTAEGFSVWLCFSVLSSLVMNYDEIGDLLLRWERSDDSSQTPKSLESPTKENVIIYYYLNFPFTVKNSESARVGMLSFLIVWLKSSQRAFEHFTKDCRCQSQLIGDMFTESRMTSLITMSLNALLYGMILVTCDKPSIRSCFMDSLKQKSNIKDLCAKISLLGKSEQFMLLNISPRVAFTKSSSPLLSLLFCQFYRENEYDFVKKLMDMDSDSVRVSEVDMMKEKISELEKNITSLHSCLNQAQKEKLNLSESYKKLQEENECLLLMIEDQDKKHKLLQRQNYGGNISFETNPQNHLFLNYPQQPGGPVLTDALMIQPTRMAYAYPVGENMSHQGIYPYPSSCPEDHYQGTAPYFQEPTNSHSQYPLQQYNYRAGCVDLRQEGPGNPIGASQSSSVYDSKVAVEAHSGYASANHVESQIHSDFTQTPSMFYNDSCGLFQGYPPNPSFPQEYYGQQNHSQAGPASSSSYQSPPDDPHKA